VGVLLGTYLHFRLSQRLFSTSWPGMVLGWPPLVFGIWIALRAAVEAGNMNIESPTSLLTTGPYSRSRNPMYVGWTILHFGIALAANSVWIAALLPAVLVFTHLVEIRREERFLKAEFGEQYLAYERRVRRYI
jgi:protein-S-isoprenylcysteine O-methyltransferase Ste14